LSAPPVTPEPGWVPVQPFPSIPEDHSFLTADPSDDRIRIAYFRAPTGDALYARVWFGAGTQGPPGQVHGGAMAAVLDEAMGGAAWMNGLEVVAARITISFLRMLPVDSETTLEAWVDLVEGRKVSARARLRDPSGRIVTEGEGLFVVLTEEQKQRLPEPKRRR
jgi:acyl-coenzyme A thioesterase PaaI-like protein